MWQYAVVTTCDSVGRRLVSVRLTARVIRGAGASLVFLSPLFAKMVRAENMYSAGQGWLGGVESIDISLKDHV